MPVPKPSATAATPAAFERTTPPDAPGGAAAAAPAARRPSARAPADGADGAVPAPASARPPRAWAARSAAKAPAATSAKAPRAASAARPPKSAAAPKSRRLPRSAPDGAAPAPGRRLQSLERKRSAILEAALHCFSRLGLHGTSVDQVAARAQVSKSNLLYYFGSKEDLYVAVLRDLLDLWLEPLREEFVPERDPAEAIRRYVARKMVDSRDHPDASRLFCLEMVRGAPLLREELDRGLAPLVEEKAAVVRGWIADGRMAPVAPKHLIFLLWSTTQHYADFAVQVEAVSGRTLADPDFFDEAVASLQALVLGGALGARIGAPAAAADDAAAGSADASPDA
ncbi:MAG: HTH-type transcriptional regulator RutR [Xylophilus ampelinus]